MASSRGRPQANKGKWFTWESVLGNTNEEGMKWIGEGKAGNEKNHYFIFKIDAFWGP